MIEENQMDNMIEENQMDRVFEYYGPKSGIDTSGMVSTFYKRTIDNNNRELRKVPKIKKEVIQYDLSITFINCDFKELTVPLHPELDSIYKEKRPPKCKDRNGTFIETIKFNKCLIHNDINITKEGTLIKFLQEDVCRNLFELYISNCEISSIESIIPCLSNIDNMKFIKLAYNRIRSIRTIIKCKSEGLLFISNHLSRASTRIKYHTEDYNSKPHYGGHYHSLWSKKVYHRGGHKENLTSVEETFMKRDPQYSQKIYAQEQLEYITGDKEGFNYIIDSWSFFRATFDRLECVPQYEQAKLKTTYGIRRPREQRGREKFVLQ